MAVVGFSLLGTEAKPAWAALIQMTCDPDWNVRANAYGCLMSSKADKEIMIPIFLRLIHDPEQRVRIWAGNDFHVLYSQEAEAAAHHDKPAPLKVPSANQSTTNQPSAN